MKGWVGIVGHLGVVCEEVKFLNPFFTFKGLKFHLFDLGNGFRRVENMKIQPQL